MNALRLPWPAIVRTTSTLGSLAVLGDYVVPAEATVILTGDQEPPPGKRWPDATLRFAIRDGEAHCIEVRITCKPTDRPIRAVSITEADIERLAEHGFGQLVGRHRPEEGAMVVESTSAKDGRPEIRKAVRGGYGVSLAELREVARTYLDPRARQKPTHSVQQVLGYKSRETTSRRIKEARDKGLIPGPGASNDELDSALRRVMNMIEKADGHGEAL